MMKPIYRPRRSEHSDVTSKGLTAQIEDEVTCRTSMRFAVMFLVKVIETVAVVTKHYFCCEVVSFPSSNTSSQQPGAPFPSCQAPKVPLRYRVAMIS